MLGQATLLALVVAAFRRVLASSGRLDARYDHSSIGTSSASTSSILEDGAQSYLRLIIFHAVLGFFALQVIAPLAVILAATGKSWPGQLWFKAHWRLQLLVVVPMTTLAVVLGAIVPAGEGSSSRMSLAHEIAGYALLGTFSLQIFFGWYSHYRQRVVERFATEHGRELPRPKRRLSNWLHMGLGIAILTVGGLEVTWGFAVYEEKLGQSVPAWVVVVHWVIAGLPVLIVTPFVLIRGVLRLRRGASLAEAFFSPYHSSSSSLRATGSHSPPRKLFLNSATYLATPVFDVDVENDDEKGADSQGGGVFLTGHEYPRGSGPYGRTRVDSVASSAWPGAETREEYEAEVASSRAPESVRLGSSCAGSLRSIATTLVNDYPTADGISQEGRMEPTVRLGPSSSFTTMPSNTRPSQTEVAPTQPQSVLLATYPPTRVTEEPYTSTTPQIPPLPALFPLESSAIPRESAGGPAPVLPPLASANATGLLPLPPRYLSSMRFSGPPPAVHPPPTSSSPASSAPSVAVEGPSPVVLPPGMVPTPPEMVRQYGRHESLSAQIEGEPSTKSTNRLGKLLPFPGEPGSPASSGSRTGEDPVGVVVVAAGNHASTAAGEEENRPAEETEGVGNDEDDDDTESSRLMDELERELTISTVRSGRVGHAGDGPMPVRDPTGEEEVKEPDDDELPPPPRQAAPASLDGPDRTSTAEGETVEEEQQTQLEREQSGKWFGSNNQVSSSS